MLSKLILAGLLTVALASAQRGGGGGEDMGSGRGSGMERAMGGMGGGGNRMDMWSNALKLNKEQKKTLKTAMDEGQKEANPVKEQMAKARLAIAEAVAAGKGQDEIEKLSAAFAAAEAQMNQIELTAFAKIYQSLEKDQQANVKVVYAMMPGIFKGKNWNEPSTN